MTARHQRRQSVGAGVVGDGLRHFTQRRTSRHAFVAIGTDDDTRDGHAAVVGDKSRQHRRAPQSHFDVAQPLPIHQGDGACRSGGASLTERPVEKSRATGVDAIFAGGQSGEEEAAPVVTQDATPKTCAVEFDDDAIEATPGLGVDDLTEQRRAWRQPATLRVIFRTRAKGGAPQPGGQNHEQQQGGATGHGWFDASPACAAGLMRSMASVAEVLIQQRDGRQARRDQDDLPQAVGI